MKKLIVGAIILAALSACNEADVASHNLSKAADNFEIDRRIVFYNGITDTYMLTIEGKCALGNSDSSGQLTVTCKVAPNAFKKHFLGLSDNVTYFVEQMETADVSTFHHRVMFRPQTIIPDFDFQGDAGELTSNPN